MATQTKPRKQENSNLYPSLLASGSSCEDDTQHNSSENNYQINEFTSFNDTCGVSQFYAPSAPPIPNSNTVPSVKDTYDCVNVGDLHNNQLKDDDDDTNVECLWQEPNDVVEENQELSEIEEHNLLASLVVVENRTDSHILISSKKLPQEVTLRICSFLSASDLIPIRKTCRAFNNAVADRLCDVAVDLIQIAGEMDTEIRTELAKKGIKAAVPLATVTGIATSTFYVLYHIPWLGVTMPLSLSRSKAREVGLLADCILGVTVTLTVKSMLKHIPAAIQAGIGVSAASVLLCLLPAVIHNIPVVRNKIRARKLNNQVARLYDMLRESIDPKELPQVTEDADQFSGKMAQRPFKDDDAYVVKLFNLKIHDDDSFLWQVPLRGGSIWNPQSNSVIFSITSHVENIGSAESYISKTSHVKYKIKTRIDFASYETTNANEFNHTHPEHHLYPPPPSAPSSSLSHINSHNLPENSISPISKYQDEKNELCRTFEVNRTFSDFKKIRDWLKEHVPNSDHNILRRFPSRELWYWFSRKDAKQDRFQYFDKFVREIVRPRNGWLLYSSQDNRKENVEDHFPEDTENKNEKLESDFQMEKETVKGEEITPILDFLGIDQGWLWNRGVVAGF
eukprot:gb/GECH01013503.1/.p1 GENE.gb/GECH01013503.1/~~gb/GECH01013503.1/.p1  ORF type:complete len:622 (+),score=144.96 gb/GECH01013503.1/:1-1866(+)